MNKYLFGSILILLVCTSTVKADKPGWTGISNYGRMEELEKRMASVEERVISNMAICRCLNHEYDVPKFYKGQTVYDVVRGKGVVVYIGSDDCPHPVWVKFPHIKSECLYTKDGKWFSFDSSPSLYDKEMKIVPK